MDFGRKEDAIVGDCTWRGALAGTPCSAESPIWVFAQTNPMHAHLKRLGLLLLLDCSGVRHCVYRHQYSPTLHESEPECIILFLPYLKMLTQTRICSFNTAVFLS